MPPPPPALPLATPVPSSSSSAFALAAASAAVRSAIAAAPPPPSCGTAAVGRRELGLSACFAALTLSLARPAPSLAAVLEADDDLELLEKVKQNRKKRLEKQGVISSSPKEKGYLQEVIYKLSKVGQAIDNDDLDAASSLLGPSTTVQWLQNVNAAFSKLSNSPEEKTEVDNFNSSLASLFASVGDRDVGSSKRAFVSSASALEKWVEFAGLVSQLKGL